MTACDFIIIGAGSAGLAALGQLMANEAGTVTVIEAGPTDRSPLVAMPFGLVWMMGRKRRDWCFTSTPQQHLGGRQIAIPRGRMLGGSSAINSMVWFRGRRDDYDAWALPGWRWHDVAPAFEAIENHMAPERMRGAHPLTEALGTVFGGNGTAVPTPEYESAGVFAFNMRAGRRWSAADAFLRPARIGADLRVMTGRVVDRIACADGTARRVILSDGTEIAARKGVILSAGSIGSPAILMRSGIGPRADLARIGIDVILDAPEIGENLHDHPSVGLYFEGRGTGYGLTLAQAPAWMLSPLRYLVTRRGRLASPTVEGGGFFNARGTGGPPDVQMHFIPFKLGWSGRRYTRGSGYFADICLCRPKSRGRLRLASKDPQCAPDIDLGLLTDTDDRDTLVAGLSRLRRIMARADFGTRRGAEVFPGPEIAGDAAISAHITRHCATAYHPVGTLRMGQGNAPVGPDLRLRGIDRLWVADASVMPAVTSANTNAPSMMIGYKAGDMIAKEAA